MSILHFADQMAGDGNIVNFHVFLGRENGEPKDGVVVPLEWLDEFEDRRSVATI